MKDYGAELFGVDEDTKEITPVGKKGYGVFIYGIMKHFTFEKRDLLQHVNKFEIGVYVTIGLVHVEL